MNGSRPGNKRPGLAPGRRARPRVRTVRGDRAAAEFRQKSAGLRTHTIVGLGSALFLLISKYGFQNVVVPGQVVVDPSRVAAQIVSGLGFIGAGLIFVQRGSVRGLTTAARIWIPADRRG